MRLSVVSALLSCALATSASARASRSPAGLKFPRETDGLQDMVTWDEYSLMINGSRVDIFSGEVHPYRMPVQSLHLDVFQKIKALGFNAISAYFFWGIHEPKRGELSFDGFRDPQPFFDAAMKAGLYVIARPGPYINAETTGGGFPGWGTYTPGLWRTSNASYVEAYQGYMKAIGAKIAANQITNGGPVILVQVENEYTGYQAPYTEDFAYESDLKAVMRSSGVTVPLIVNDAYPGGHFLDVDIYGYDSYPNGFDCAHPDVWLPDAVPESSWAAHEKYSPQSPNAIFEFQGGAFDPWGGAGYEGCARRLGPEFERVFYKNQFAMSTTMINFYMIFGGTNWGGIAHPGVYTSYDYGAAIAEDRTLREKAYELKLQALFRAASPAFLTSRPTNVRAAQGAFTGNPALKTTQVLDVVGGKTGFYVVRQTDASTTALQAYTLTLPTSVGNLTIPTLGGTLALDGRDSKIHVVDYAAGSTNILYSTGEILTWATIDERDVILVYGNTGELHETAFTFASASPIPRATVVSGPGSSTLKTKPLPGNALALQYTTSGQTVVQLGPRILLYILDRATAYQFWVLHPPAAAAGPFAQFSTQSPVLVKGAYLLRAAAATAHGALALRGDLNGTAPTQIEIIAPAAFTRGGATFNGAPLALGRTRYGTLTAQRRAVLPAVALPDLAALPWKTADSLPEVLPSFSDARWTRANLTASANPAALRTPVVLFAGDYGFHTGAVLWRAHFAASAKGEEEGFRVEVQGGSGFGFSVWLDAAFLGSYAGDGATPAANGTFAFPARLRPGSAHVLTILQDHMGYEENWWAGADFFKLPRGILSYSFVGSAATDTDTVMRAWKVAGNLGGESYADPSRGPLNEGGFFGERQGWHLPGFDDRAWAAGAPTAGLARAGVGFFRTAFALRVPGGVDYPLSLVFANTTTTTAGAGRARAFRAQVYVNGWQFGKYVNHVGPQTAFPVPQGILNYGGENTLAVALWAMEAGGARVEGLALRLTARVESAMGPVANVPAARWAAREGAC
ncbi:glycoside hydrolase family 35 protein [Mycena belliarum]|uniref:Beta-galactosidase n=1 Tax=Mycena belliarum TaxID=1033014 RepID=A0AAD6U251_9AGAR|nr:glycoside hydrolase family 35 protein [Mycena belliae]